MRSSLLLLTLAATAAAQCLVENGRGSNLNVNRPGDASVPAASFTPLADVNRLLPRWLCFTAGYRARLESSSSDAYLLSRFRLGTLFRPARWLKAYVELQDAGAFWKTPPRMPPYQSTWDLRRAYIDIGNVEESPVSLRAGRQDLNFGYGRLVGTSYWRNASRGFDAAMLSIKLDWLRLRMFAASPVVPLANGLSHHQQGNNIHGIYGGLSLLPHSVIEPYVFWRLSPRAQTEAGKLARLDEKAIGVRAAGYFSHFDYDVELTRELGHVGADRIRAWGWAAIAGYTLASVPWKPRLFAEYDYASGDPNPRDGRKETFDQLYPNVHDHHGLADQVAWQNLKEFRSGVRVAPRRNWTVAAMYSDWWLASARDGFYNSSGGIVVRDPNGLSGTHIGVELDLETSYRINRDLELGAGLGRVFPGTFLSRMHRGSGYTYPYVMVNYNVF